MRKFILTFVFFTFLFPLSAEELATTLTRTLARLSKEDSNVAARLAQVSPCLRGRSYCTVLSWAQAANKYNSATENIKQRKQKIQAYQKALAPLAAVHKATVVPYSPQEEQKAFEKLANEKFIILGETHIKGVRAGIQRALQTIRKKNPTKRILLATEMAVTYAPTTNLPFEKAGTHNEQIRPQNDELQPILTTARQLKMDLLALDDRWLERAYDPLGELIYPIKLGNYLIEAPSNDAQVQQITSRRYGQNYSQHPVLTIYALHDFLGGSWWGIQERNRQWTNYLKAVQQDYDVIVVYGGAGHFNTLENVSSVPQRLGLKKYAYLTFSKVPTAAEKNEMEKRLQSTMGTSTQHSYESKAAILYQKAPSVTALPNTIKQKYAAALKPVVALEKELGFYNDQSLQMRIILPQ